MVVETEAARLLTYRCAHQRDKGILNNTLETSMAKYFASEAASKVADDAFRTMAPMAVLVSIRCEDFYAMLRCIRS